MYYILICIVYGINGIQSDEYLDTRFEQLCMHLHSKRSYDKTLRTNKDSELENVSNSSCSKR